MRPISETNGLAQGDLNETLVERSGSTKRHPVCEISVSVCRKDILSGMHDEMNVTTLLLVVGMLKTLLTSG